MGRQVGWCSASLSFYYKSLHWINIICQVIKIEIIDYVICCIPFIWWTHDHEMVIYEFTTCKWNEHFGKSSESVQCAMLKACDACADMGQWHTVPVRKTFQHFSEIVNFVIMTSLLFRFTLDNSHSLGRRYWFCFRCFIVINAKNFSV